MRLKILLFNPYLNSGKTGATSRIEALQELVNDKLIVEKRTLKVRAKFLIYPFGILYGGFLYLKSRSTIFITEFILLPILFPNIALLIHDNKNLKRETRRSWLKSKIYHYSLRRVKNVILVNPIVKNEFEIKFGDSAKSKFHVIKNPIKQIFLKQQKEYQDSRKEYDFIYISSFAPHKNHIRLIDSCPKDKLLVLVGSDLGYKKVILEYVKKSKKNVVIFENIEDAELILLLKKTKVGVFPSTLEGFGIPIMEYAAMNMPIATSNLKEFDTFKNLIDYQFDPFNTQEMNSILLKALRDCEESYSKDKRSEVLKFNESVKEDAIKVISKISLDLRNA